MSPQRPHDRQHRGRGGAGSGTSWFVLFLTSATPWFFAVLIVAVLVFAVMGALAHYAVAEHGAHLLQAWPVLIVAVLALAVFPLVKLLRGGGGDHRQDQEPPP